MTAGLALLYKGMYSPVQSFTQAAGFPHQVGLDAQSLAK